jgi:hypothetical protein
VTRTDKVLAVLAFAALILLGLLVLATLLGVGIRPTGR